MRFTDWVYGFGVPKSQSSNQTAAVSIDLKKVSRPARRDCVSWVFDELRSMPSLFDIQTEDTVICGSSSCHYQGASQTDAQRGYDARLSPLDLARCTLSSTS